MSIAVYAGTFDPLTLGHLSVIRQAVRLFAHVRVLVAVHPRKAPLFSLEARTALAREALEALPTVSVACTEGLVVDYARHIGAGVLVRGMRSAADAAYETDLAQANRELAPDLLTVLVPAEPALSMISSSGVKEMAARGEDVRAYCPAPIAERLIALLGAGSAR